MKCHHNSRNLTILVIWPQSTSVQEATNCIFHGGTKTWFIQEHRISSVLKLGHCLIAMLTFHFVLIQSTFTSELPHCFAFESLLAQHPRTNKRAYLLEEQRLQCHAFDYIFYRHKRQLLGTIFWGKRVSFPHFRVWLWENGADSSSLRFGVPLKCEAFSFTWVPAVSGCLQCGNYNVSVSSSRSTDNRKRHTMAIWKVFIQPSIHLQNMDLSIIYPQRD